MELKIGQRVRKTKGYPFPGTYRGSVNTEKGYERVIVEHEDGWLHIFNPEQIEADRLSPPAPEVDEATKIAREFVARYHARAGYPMMAERARKGEYDKDRLVDVECLRQTTAELIASKDDEIAEWKSQERIAFGHQQKAESELATLRAENERLKADCARLQQALAIQEGVSDTVHEALWAADKAAERNTAKPEKELPDLIVTKGGVPFEDQAEGVRQFKAACLANSKPAPGTNAGAVEVTEADIDTFQDLHGVQPVSRLDHLITQRYAKVRTEAEARGRRQALETVVQDLRNMSRGHVAHECALINQAADRVERMMTEPKP